jgi:hypothetical protein
MRPVNPEPHAAAEGGPSGVKRWLAPRAVILAGAMVLLAAGTAGADVVGLPADGGQANNDPAVGIDAGQNAGASDVVGGTLTPGGPRVPWATFEQTSGSSQQIFVRAFKNGQWATPDGPMGNVVRGHR